MTRRIGGTVPELFLLRASVGETALGREGGTVPELRLLSASVGETAFSVRSLGVIPALTPGLRSRTECRLRGVITTNSFSTSEPEPKPILSSVFIFSGVCSFNLGFFASLAY